MARETIQVNKLVGRIDEEYYFLEYTFDEGNAFRGAVGYSLRPVSFAEAEERRLSWDDDGEDWRMAVAAEETTLGMDDWHEWVKAIEDDELLFDFSYTSQAEAEQLLAKLQADDPDVELLECVGGGRCFSHKQTWDEVFDREALDLALSYEEVE